MLIEFANHLCFAPETFAMDSQDVVDLVDFQALSINHMLNLDVAAYLNFLVHRLVHVQLLL